MRQADGTGILNREIRGIREKGKSKDGFNRKERKELKEKREISTADGREWGNGRGC